MLIPVLSLLALLSAALTIRAKYANSRRAEYLFKPLTMICIILIALLADDPLSATYQRLIVAGLAASLVGDVLLMLPSDRLLQGLIAFLVAHVLYIIAFTRQGSGTAPMWYAIPFALYGVIIVWRLWPHLGSKKAPVMLYVGIILIMAWQAANRWIETDQPGSLLALIGAYLFVLSDSVLAFERFRAAFRSAPFWVLSTYFAAQWLIALSV
ncbi:MAG: lysoplasmalogenase [Anaerolineae bacterium]|jgi:uncharacterized membrane protein YhhN|nr:lysoplasmalogenase [Anaerolineae bacterium]